MVFESVKEVKEKMIFEYIRFRNYLPYYGEQIIYFRDQDHVDHGPVKKNIVLIGGLNGHGKTSLIQAINICLFGRLKFRSSREYGEFLSKAVNNKYQSEGGKEGSIELAFTDELNSTYAINVTFHAGKMEEIRKMFVLDKELNIKEETQLSQEEIIDFIDQRIPTDVSQFFIFDAEKIRELLGDRNKEETRGAIQKVVQLELYNQLLKDIDKVQYQLCRSEESLKGNNVSALNGKLKKTTEELVDINNELKEIDQELDLLKNDEIERNIERRKLYANNLQSKEELVKKIGRKEERLVEVIKRLKNLKSDELQKIILQRQIRSLKKRLQEEKEYLNAKLIENAKFAPYETFIKQLLNAVIQPPITDVQKRQLKEIGKEIWARVNNIQQEMVSKKIDILHDSLSPEEYQFLITCPVIQSSTIKEDVNEKQRLEKEIIKYEKMLKQAPDRIDTSTLDKEIAKINQRKGQLRERKKSLTMQKNHLISERVTINKEIKKAEGDLKQFKAVSAQLDLVHRLYKGIREFIDQVTYLKAIQLKEEIERILGQLFRKKDFQRIEFDPEKFQLQIYNRFNQLIELESRSEGEKQIIALAIIWALTKVSGSNFPFVIDTPVARLDNAHRSNLVDNYFTKLSDQVIILSTDSEITEEFYRLLSPFICKEYTLNYDISEGITKIKEGYLFLEGEFGWPN